MNISDVHDFSQSQNDYMILPNVGIKEPSEKKLKRSFTLSSKETVEIISPFCGSMPLENITGQSELENITEENTVSSPKSTISQSDENFSQVEEELSLKITQYTGRVYFKTK